MDNDVAGILAFLAAAAGSIIAAVRKEVAIALAAAGVALLSLAVAVRSL